MIRYRIGKIEGAWKNFIPPIQGGVFRSKSDMGSRLEESTANDAESNSSISRPPSPVFDQDGARWRGGKKTSERPASVSSQSSTMPEEPMDGLTYLDSLTNEYIKLDLDKYPDLDHDTQATIIEKYRALHKRIQDEGLYECNYGAYGWECLRYISLFGLMCFFLSIGLSIPAAMSLGFMWHLLVFTAHDAGHMAITHNFQVDSVIGIIIADFIGGLSMGWWKRNHNVHHIVTNSPEHDPDIEHMPIFAISHRLLANLRSSYYDRIMKYDAFAKVLLRIQPYTYFPILVCARFNLYVLSWDYLLLRRGPRRGIAAWFWWLEMAGQLFFWTWFGYGIMYRCLPDNWSRFVFLLVSHLSSGPLHIQIVLSHFAMSTADLGPGESFPQKMLRTTMDIDCPEWLDFYHGGLQFQAIHHLFPRVPRHNFRTIRKYVEEFCEESGIPYALYGFTKGNQEVIGRLAEVSRQAAILGKCQKAILESDDFMMH